MLETYKKFLEGLTVYNTVAGGLGEAYTKPTSIPQGDPFSIMISNLAEGMDHADEVYRGAAKIARR